MMRACLSGAALALLLAGCAATHDNPLGIDRSRQAVGQSSRVQFVVIHYTSAPLARSLDLLTTHQVSAHYLVTDETQPRIMQLVDESRSAWHAGQSSWYGRNWLNANAVGIEIVNPGYITPRQGQQQWAPYPDAQVQKTIALIKDIVARHGIAPENVVGHSDIAPQRKVDPGPLFPWDALARAGIGRWFDPAQVAQLTDAYLRNGVPDIAWFQQQLSILGYSVPQHGQFDRATRNVIAAFQMHYRPARHDGEADAQTAAILAALPKHSGLPPLPKEAQANKTSGATPEADAP